MDGNDPAGLVESPSRLQRIAGRVGGDRPGPLMIIMTGIHGNEPAAVEAAVRLLREIEPLRDRVRGELAILNGNLTALAGGTRFVHRDLNRQWTPDQVDALRAGRATQHVEDRELLEIDRTIREIVANRQPGSQIYFLDLHTASADGPPFVTVGDTLRNRRFALNFPLPLILGLEEQVDGALLEYLNNFGFVTMGAEAGQHQASSSIDIHESILWLALVHAGLLAAEDVPRHDELYRRLQQAGEGLPRVLEVRRRHAIHDDDRFTMEKGFASFQPVERDEILATDRNGMIGAPEEGRVLLPLYQGKGDDGFFIARDVKRFWLTVSGILRRLRFAALLPFLPGVRRHPYDPGMLVVNTRIARIYPLEIFHLLGFRKIRERGRELVVSRRLHDLKPPDELTY